MRPGRPRARAERWVASASCAGTSPRCRGLEPQATPEEVEAAARQFVRKVSGVQKTSAATEAAFERAVRQIADITASCSPTSPSASSRRPRSRRCAASPPARPDARPGPLPGRSPAPATGMTGAVTPPR